MEINPQSILQIGDGILSSLTTCPSTNQISVFVTPGADETYHLWSGNCEEPDVRNCFVFFRDERAWNVEISEGAEYVSIQTASDALCQINIDPGNSFIWQNSCMHLVFNEQRPDSVARVRITFSSGIGTANYTYYIYKPVYHILHYTFNWENEIDFGSEQLLQIQAVNQCGGTWPYLPADIYYNVEIIQGNEYGQLWNPETDEYGSNFNSLYHSKRFMQYLYFVANGNSPNEREQIIIRVSTIDPTIDPITVNCFVLPSNIVVTLEPPQILPGEMAEIKIKQRDEFGILEDLPPEQQFEIGMLDGCSLGKLNKDEVDTNYLYGVTQPIYFIADSSADSGTVKIRAGLIEEIGASKPVTTGTEQENKLKTTTARRYDIILNKTKNAIANTNNNINTFLEANLENEFCYTGIYEAQEYGVANLVVGNDCEDYPCDQGFVYSPPSIVSKLDDIIWSNTFTNEHGTKVFSGQKGGETFILFDDKFYVNQYPIKDELIQTFQIEPCFKNNNWQFLITTAGDNNEIKLKVYVALYDWGYPNDIDNINELNIIPENENCLALKDFEKHRPYYHTENYIGYVPPPGIEKYYIKEMAINHEKVHVQFFQLDIKDALKIKIKHYGVLKTFRDHLKFIPNCTSIFNNKNNARYQATKYYNLLLKEFVKQLQIVNRSRFPDDRTKENKTQWNDDVQRTIDYYQRELRAYWKNQGKPIRNCDLKEFDWSGYTQYKNKF